eukprot:2485387-Prymnesium_polylepis.1
MKEGAADAAHLQPRREAWVLHLTRSCVEVNTSCACSARPRPLEHARPCARHRRRRLPCSSQTTGRRRRVFRCASRACARRTSSPGSRWCALSSRSCSASSCPSSQ